MEDTRLVVFKFLFLFLCVLLFFLLVFSFFRGLSNISSVKAIFRKSLLIQKYLSDGNFRNCLPAERVFTEQVFRTSLCLELSAY